MRGRKGFYATLLRAEVRVDVTGHEKAAFVKARARDREVAQRSSLGSTGVASLDRRGGDLGHSTDLC